MVFGIKVNCFPLYKTTVCNNKIIRMASGRVYPFDSGVSISKDKDKEAVLILPLSTLDKKKHKGAATHEYSNNVLTVRVTVDDKVHEERMTLEDIEPGKINLEVKTGSLEVHVIKKKPFSVRQALFK